MMRRAADVGRPHVGHVDTYSVSWETSRGRLLQESRSRRENNNVDMQAHNGESECIYMVRGSIPW
jgi:hypothetical protein